MPNTPNHTIRVPDHLWDAVAARAADYGETVTDVITHALWEYLDIPDGTVSRETSSPDPRYPDAFTRFIRATQRRATSDVE